MNEDNIKVLIIGTDINAYYMSRCYHELTGKKADIIGNRAIPYTSISNPIVIKDFNNKENFSMLNDEIVENIKENELISEDKIAKLEEKNKLIGTKSENKKKTPSDKKDDSDDAEKRGPSGKALKKGPVDLFLCMTIKTLPDAERSASLCVFLRSPIPFAQTDSQ